VRARRLVERQRQIRVDFAEEEPRARIAREQQRVLADPAEAGVARQRFFEHRRRIGEHAMAERPGDFADAVGELL